MARVASSEEEAKHTPGNVAPVWTVDDLISVGVDNPAYYDSESGLCTKLPSTETKKPSWQSHKEMSFPTDDVHKSQCSFRAVLILTAASFLVIVLLATIATVAYIAVGEPTINWAAEDLNEDGGISVIEGQLKITNRIFTKDLLIPNSQAYLKLSAQVKQSMDAVFLQSGLAPYYNETGIVSYSPGSVILRCRIHLSKSRLDATHEVGMAVIQALERHHGFLPGGYLHVDIRSLHFIGLENKVQDSAPENYLHGLPVATWSPWSEWTPCKHPCDIQSRFRKCRIERGNNLLEHSEPCAQLDGSDREVRNCPCPPPPSPHPAEPITIENNSSTNCEDCGEHKICLLLSQTSTAQCLVPRDANDPTGCGGWCVGQHEICKPLDNNTFQCMDNSECLPQQWQCANGLCISLEDRCDGQFGCYDMSDEFNCECKPDEFHCGNNTSCLPKGLLCNGQVDCWDASDEFNCTQLCPTSQYTCNTGRCIDKLHFCDGYPDCDDGSDEPEGCSGPCLHTQKQCHNGRCINSLLWCNAADDCGDGTDELYCDAPQMLHENNHHRPAE